DGNGAVVVDAGQHRQHVDLLVGDEGGDVPQQANAVPGFEPDVDRVELPLVVPPADLHQTTDLVDVGHVVAVAPVHGDAATARDVADDRVAIDRLAAGGQPSIEVPDPLDAQ